MLPQPLLIFRKDLQHLWPETLIVVGLFVAFCFAAPSGWSGSEYAPYVLYLSYFLKFFLMPISWLVVISRLIQDEPLVGDRQFWTSRPYHWAQLLLAKVLYILVFLYLPFFLMQVYLLKHAGLHPMLVVPALLHNLLLLTVILVIPIMAIAAVTSSFARVLLTFIGLLIALIVLGALLGYLNFLTMLPPHLDWIANTLFVVLPAIALLYQYRTRRTGNARWMLIATPLIVILIYLLAPTNSMIAHAYPVASGADAPRLTPLISPDALPPQSSGELITLRKMVILRLPVTIAGIDEKNDYSVQGDRVTLTAPGVQYTSSFSSSRGTQFVGGSPVSIVLFYLPAAIFEKVKDVPADLHLQLATQHLAALDAATWKATQQPFSVPGNGICSFAGPHDLTQQTTCRYPFASPEISSVTAEVTPGACGDTSARHIPGRANLSGEGGALEFDPVVTVPMQFRTANPNATTPYTLCPGTDLHFIQARTLPKASLIVDAKQVVLAPYAMRRPAPGAAPAVNQPQPE